MFTDSEQQKFVEKQMAHVIDGIWKDTGVLREMLPDGTIIIHKSKPVAKKPSVKGKSRFF